MLSGPASVAIPLPAYLRNLCDLWMNFFAGLFNPVSSALTRRGSRYRFANAGAEHRSEK
jgi:hypothetical protein